MAVHADGEGPLWLDVNLNGCTDGGRKSGRSSIKIIIAQLQETSFHMWRPCLCRVARICVADILGHIALPERTFLLRGDAKRDIEQ